MKTLQDIKNEFLKEALEFDSGKKEEDFHAYLRHHKLDHYLSETQRQNKQMESNYLNGIGMTLAIGVPLTLGAIFGSQKLTSALIGHSGHKDFNYDEGRSLFNMLGEPVGSALDNKPSYLLSPSRESSLSGFNTRQMPVAPGHLGQDFPRYYDQTRRGFEERVINPDLSFGGTKQFPSIPVNTRAMIAEALVPQEQPKSAPPLSMAEGGGLFPADKNRQKTLL
jgi:hypothetical protein